jgi:hypothetical protein
VDRRCKTERVQTVALTWDQSGLLAGGLYAGAYTLSRARASGIHRIWPFVREAATIAVLYSLWQLVGTLSLIGTNGAYARGRWIVRFQDDLHIERESTVQSWVLPHPVLAQLCNLYYAGLHFFGLFAMLIWLFARHRDHYARARLSVIVLTAACLLVQLLPVAPPRLVPQAGVVDVAQRYGQSVYGSMGAGVDQLSAMPSVHVGWAILIAMVIIRVSRSPWRWLATVYPAATTFVVIATGNHFWLDGIVAAALLLVGEVAISGIERLRRRRSALQWSDPPGVYTSV